MAHRPPHVANLPKQLSVCGSVQCSWVVEHLTSAAEGSSQAIARPCLRHAEGNKALPFTLDCFPVPLSFSISTSVPWEVKEFNRLGAGAEVLTATDFELPSNCWVMSRICFTSSGILYSLLSTKAWSSDCCKAFIQGIRMNWQCLASRTCIWTTWAAPANPTKDQWLCWSLLWPLRVGQKGLPKWRHPRRLSHVARELRFAGLASRTSPSSLVDTAKSSCGLGASDSQSRGVWLPTFCVCKHLRRRGKSSFCFKFNSTIRTIDWK